MDQWCTNPGYYLSLWLGEYFWDQQLPLVYTHHVCTLGTQEGRKEEGGGGGRVKGHSSQLWSLMMNAMVLPLNDSALVRAYFIFLWFSQNCM